jgi:hypothetical protein
MTAVPAISVLMAVRNGGAFLEPALRSVMDQTFRDIEILVVDDASTDATPAVLARLAGEDPRIRVIRLAQNLRLPRALNAGLDAARAPLVARMDADDIAHPTRLAVQKAFMDANPEVVLCGASVRQIDPAGQQLRISRRGRDPVQLRWQARFNMPLVHPTFMMRRFAPGGVFQRYDPEAGVAEDYDYVARALDCGAVAALPDVLLDYRQHGSSINARNWQAQQALSGRIALARQQADLPAAVVAALAPFRAAYFAGERVPAAAILAGLRAMLAHDRAALPGHARWMARQAAQLAEAALRRSGRGRGAVAAAFLGPGRDLALPLALRLAEIRGLLRGGGGD